MPATTKVYYEGLQELTQPMLHSIVEHASDGIVVVDRDGYVLLANAAAERLFRRGDIEGEAFGFPIAAGESAEIDILAADGSRGVAEMRVSEAGWGPESVYVALLRDISERKRIESALRHAKEELAALYRCAPLGVIALKTDWRVTLWNTAAERIFGLRGEEMIGSMFPRLPELLRLNSTEIDEFSRRGNAITGREIRHVRRDGTPVDVAVSLAAVRDDAGRAAN